MGEIVERGDAATADLGAVQKQTAMPEVGRHVAEENAATAQQKAAQLEASLLASEAKAIAVQQETARLEANLRAAVADHNKARLLFERVEQELRASEEMHRTLRERLASAEARAMAAEAERAAVLASLSWRLTRPLRTFLDSRRWRRWAKLVRETGLFDDEYYRRSNPDVAKSRMDGALHFALHGWKEGRKPSPGFDPAFYLDQNPDVKALGMNPLFHYVRYGQSEGRQPLPGSDTDTDTSPDAELENMIRQTGLFDEEYYGARYPDVNRSGMNGALHFALYGWKEGRRPSPGFDPGFYLDQNPDVRAAEINPLLHYAQHGRSEGRRPLPPAADAMKAAILGRVELLEQRAASLESLMKSESGRIDWALGSVEGVTAEIDAYHSYRETQEYRAAYSSSAPLVSVCVATMDRADLLLERSISSLRTQSYRNLQVIVVGDNCSDDTALRLAALRDHRIQFINLRERGPYPRPGTDRWYVAGTNAVNHALSLCEGQFVTHLDDDDAMVPHRIEKLLAEALQYQSDFLWHSFWSQKHDGSWICVGNGRLELNQITTGSIFYHRYFTRFPWDVRAYRLREPGDWNRVRKIKLLRPHARFVDEPLLYHYVEGTQPALVPRDGERFLE